ncbi:hypothetical protein XOC_4264 [Xanthomonas oryzae pv. oryzicola BLS256]|uniref:Uncharacterized protein n=1 Tax=Xanthomonas oryzae pv. oryzicola (strain BLS256) TaxID=383407 RepID=G7TL90_XANOB|nr:hypothetical protein XOC_4264 [Xanthomonas oryzae pv. oryzicola BLS256]QEO95456.1 hypothetical protein XOCgx_0462 [Xanthomonas oryzae pv. oryzicola]
MYATRVHCARVWRSNCDFLSIALRRIMAVGLACGFTRLHAMPR